MDTKEDLQEKEITISTPSDFIYKVCLLNDQGNVDTVIVFSGDNDNIDFKSSCFSEQETEFYETIQPQLIQSKQLIHLDDSISSVKKKLLNEFTTSETSYDELYLFGNINKYIDIKSCYEYITNNDEFPFTKPIMGQFLNNLQVTDPSIYESLSNEEDDINYSYNQLMKYLLPYQNKFNNYFPLGLDFASSTDYLFSANPFSILPTPGELFKLKSNNLLYSFENRLLLDYQSIENNTIYMCSCKNVLLYGNQNHIDSSYLISLYFPLLSKKNITNLEELEENKQSLLENTKNMMSSSFFKLQENIKTFHQLDFMKLNQLPYMDNGIVNFHIVLHPKLKTFIPIDIIFKQLSSTQEFPFIKYNPGSKKESIVRLYCDKKTKKGQKIPILNKQTVYTLFKNSGKVKQLSVYIKKVIDTQLVECFVDFDYNGNIILRSISTKHISYNNLQNLLSNIINPLVDKINSFIQSSGYVMQKFSSLENELVEIIHLDYHLSIQLNPTFDLHKYDHLLYGIFDINSFDVKKGAELYFKRVSNYTQMTAIDAMISKFVKTYNDPNLIVNLISGNFNLSFEEAKEKFLDFQNSHQFINGKYVNKGAELVEQPGFETKLLFQPFENKLNIDIKNIDNILYVPLLQTYINSFLRFIHYDSDLPLDKTSYMKKVKNLEPEKEENIVENVIVPGAEAAGIIQIVNTNIFKSDDVEEEEFSDDDDALFLDDDDEDEEDDSENSDEEDDEEEDEEEEKEPEEKLKDSIVFNIKSQIISKSKEKQSSQESSPEEPSEEEKEEEEESPDNILAQQEENLKMVQEGINDGIEKTKEFFSNLTGSSQEKQKGGNTRMFIKKMKDLQPVLFKKTSEYEDSYARNCQANSRRQPIILTNEEKMKIDETYPNSYDIALPYSTDENKKYWYICPRYWCLQTNAPMSEEQVEKGECGGKIIPQSAKTAPAGHYIMEFTDDKEHKDKEGNYRKHYPGFLTKKNGAGYCLPCCFKRLNTDQQLKMRKDCGINISDYSGESEDIEKIIGTEDKNIDMDDKKLLKNILLPERFPMPAHRWGFLPIGVETFLQVDSSKDVDKNNKANIEKNKTPLLRYGMEFSRNQSFVAFLNDLHSTYQNKMISLAEFREALASDISFDLFLQSNNSNLVSSFLPRKYILDNSSIDKVKSSEFYKSIDTSNEFKMNLLKDNVASYENFLNYLRDPDSFIDHTFLWDLVTSGKLSLFPEKFNLIILELPENDGTNDVEILCPTNVNRETLFDKKLKSVFVLKNKVYYEPVYKYGNTVVNKNAGNKTVVKFLSENSVSSEFRKVIQSIEHSTNKFCKPIQNSAKVYNYKTNLHAERILQILKDNSITIQEQIVNYKSKVIAFTIKVRDEDNQNYYIPTYPSNIIENLNVKYIDDVEWSSYEETKQILEDIYYKSQEKIPSKPLVKVVEDGLIVGILTLSNQFVPVNDFIEDKEDDLDSVTTSNYKDDYINADKALTSNENKKDTQRVEVVRNIYLETQFYNSFRNKMRNLLSDYFHFETKKKLEEIIHNNSYLYVVKLEKIKRILKYLSKENIVFQEFDDEVFDALEEKIGLLNVNKDNQFCLEEENKLCLPKNNLISAIDNETYYYEKLADELLRYKRIQLFMLQASQYLTIHHFDYIIQTTEILILQSALFENFFKDLEPFETSSYVTNVGFDISNPEAHPPYSNKIKIDQQKPLDANTKSIELIEENCVSESKKIIEAPFNKWDKFVSSEENYLTFENSPFCSFYIIIHILKEKNVEVRVIDLKNKLIELYNEAKPRYFSNILSILSLQDKKEYVDKLKSNQIDFDSMILSEEYTLSHLDLLLLCNHFKIPIVLFSKSKFKNIQSNLSWMVLGENVDEDAFYFIYGSSLEGFSQKFLIENPIYLRDMVNYNKLSSKPDYKEHFITIENILSLET